MKEKEPSNKSSYLEESDDQAGGAHSYCLDERQD